MTRLPRGRRSVAPNNITICRPNLVPMSEEQHRQAVAALSRLFAAVLQDEQHDAAEVKRAGAAKLRNPKSDHRTPQTD